MSKRTSLSWIGRAALTALGALVCIQPLAAQPVATVEQLLGTVSLMQDGRIDKPLIVGFKVKAQQIVVTGPDGYAKFHLEDNSTFEVYQNSTVKFRDDWPSLTYLLDIVLGRVKVFIDHSKGPNNNSVSTPTAVISVRGTVFDVVVEDADGTTFVTCDEGAVQIMNRTAPGPEPILHPGESKRIFRGQPLAKNGINKNGVVERAILQAGRDAIQVVLQQRGGIGGIGGGVPGTTTTGGGAQGDKGKGGAAPPPAPSGSGH